MSLKHVTAAAIRMVRHEMEYTRLVQRNRCNAAGIPPISAQWVRLVDARRELEREVKMLKGEKWADLAENPNP